MRLTNICWHKEGLQDWWHFYFRWIWNSYSFLCSSSRCFCWPKSYAKGPVFICMWFVCISSLFLDAFYSRLKSLAKSAKEFRSNLRLARPSILTHSVAFKLFGHLQDRFPLSFCVNIDISYLYWSRNLLMQACVNIDISYLINSTNLLNLPKKSFSKSQKSIDFEHLNFG